MSLTDKQIGPGDEPTAETDISVVRSLAKMVRLVALPFVGLLSPRAAYRMIVRPPEGSLRTPANEAYFETVRFPPDVDQSEIDDVIAGLEALIEEDAWDEISAQIAEWEASGARPGASELRWSDMALDVIRQMLSDRMCDRNTGNLGASYEIPGSALARVEEAANANPSDPVLTAVLALLHLDRGGQVPAEPMFEDHDGTIQHRLPRNVEIAQNLLTRFDLRDVRSPTVSRVSFQLLAAMNVGMPEMRDAYLAWSDLDVTNPLPHRAMARHAMTTTPDGWATLEKEALAAANRTGPVIGPEAYAHFYLHALEQDEKAVVRMDLTRLEEALDSLVARQTTPSEAALTIAIQLTEASDVGVVMIWQEVLKHAVLRKKSQLRQIARRLVQRWVTHLPTEAHSQLDRKALDTISTLFQKELQDGQSIQFSEAGLRLLTVEEAAEMDRAAEEAAMAAEPA